MENPSIMNHVSLGVTDAGRSFAFYDAVLATIGAQRIVSEDDVVAYGKMFPEFWVHGATFDGGAPAVANGVHFSFFATSREMVQAFYDTALANGGTSDGEPGPRPQYGDPYYGCFVRDPDGHKLEATFWDAPPPDM